MPFFGCAGILIFGSIQMREEQIHGLQAGRQDLLDLPIIDQAGK